MLAIQAALLSAITFGASIYTLFRSWGDVPWWGWLRVLTFAALGYQRAAFDFFIEEFAPACTEQVYHDDEAIIYRLTCLP
jgi:hypothetical protein